MKHSLLLMLSLFMALFAMDTVQVNRFIAGSITPANAHSLGFSVDENLNEITFGTAIVPGDIHPDSLDSYPRTGFAETANISYVPVIKDGTVRCFVVINSEGKAVSLGYRALAEELSRVASIYNIPMEVIGLYRSTQINSYLFSVPSKTRSSNLTVLRPGWDRARSGLGDEIETVEMLRSAVGGAQ